MNLKVGEQPNVLARLEGPSLVTPRSRQPRSVERPLEMDSLPIACKRKDGRAAKPTCVLCEIRYSTLQIGGLFHSGLLAGNPPLKLETDILFIYWNSTVSCRSQCE